MTTSMHPLSRTSKERRGIPTTYAGVRFRSRLEARWAVFFDALKWPWSYEPLDLDGYIPDFVLTFEAGPIALEVKPMLQLPDLREHAQRIVFSGWREEVLAVGAKLFGHDVIGINGEPIGSGETVLGAAKLFRCLSCGELSFLNDDHGHRCRLCGCREDHVGWIERDRDIDVAATWAASGNRVQWRPE